MKAQRSKPRRKSGGSADPLMARLERLARTSPAHRWILHLLKDGRRTSFPECATEKEVRP